MNCGLLNASAAQTSIKQVLACCVVTSKNKAGRCNEQSDSHACCHACSSGRTPQLYNNASLPASTTALQSRKQCAPVLVLLWDFDSQSIADSRVQQAAKLAKAIQGQHNDSSQQAAKQLSKHIDEGSVPIAVEDDCWAQNPSRVKSCSCELPTCMLP